jgi:hypothetical protein
LEGNEASKYDGPDIGWAGKKKKKATGDEVVQLDRRAMAH